MHRFRREIERLLRETRQPFEIRSSTNHDEIFLAGAKIATVSRGGTGRDTLKLQSAIRQRMRQLQ